MGESDPRGAAARASSPRAQSYSRAGRGVCPGILAQASKMLVG